MAGIVKIYSAESQRRRKVLIPFIVVCLVMSAFMQSVVDPHARKLREGTEEISTFGGLNNEFLLLPLLGFREAAAGLLWVRCDEFFHSGDYDAILPLVRLITWLDPHADNVYITGAWHLAYNFTDSNERSDRRYIGFSQALLKEGVRNNPSIPDINFELGWQNYDKIKDYAAAESAFKAALATKPNPNNEEAWPFSAPLKTNHILAHTYEKRGRLPEAIAEWQHAQELSATQIDPKKREFKFWSLNQAEKHNLDIDRKRWQDRYTNGPHTEINVTDHPGILGLAKGMAPKVWDVGFQPLEGKAAFIEVVRPKVFKIAGRANMADGARVDVRLTDWNYKERELGGRLEKFEVDQTQTILVDALSVRKAKFEREIDMSKDPKMYGFIQSEYKLVISFNPRTTSPHVQDRFGYSGEGLTDESHPNFVFYDRRLEQMGTKMIEGQGGDGPIWDGQTVPWKEYGQPLRMIKVTYRLSKAQLQGLQPITEKDIVPNE